MQDLPGFANSDASVRTNKARKIEFLLGGVEGADLLDLGAGSGLLSAYFASKGANVTSADRDVEEFKADLPFVSIDGQALPFADNSFDIIIFNHVIEHVGEEPAQLAILAEIARILRADGRLYIAAPTKWAFMEPHYRLPFLGALPRPLADLALRITGKGQRYDCFPLSRTKLRAAIQSQFAEVEEQSAKAFRWMQQHENPKLRFLPALVPLFPTSIFIARQR